MDKEGRAGVLSLGGCGWAQGGGETTQPCTVLEGQIAGRGGVWGANGCSCTDVTLGERLALVQGLLSPLVRDAVVGTPLAPRTLDAPHFALRDPAVSFETAQE